MNVRTLATIAALAVGALLTGCVAQVGQPQEKTGTSQSSLGDNNGGGDDPGSTDPGNTTTDNNASDPGDNATSGDNQGPQPVPWTTTGTGTGTGGTDQKKK